MRKWKIILMIMGAMTPGIVNGGSNRTPLPLPNNEAEKVEIRNKGTVLSIYVRDIDFYKWPILCSTIVVYSTSPFNESLINMYNAPPKGEK